MYKSLVGIAAATSLGILAAPAPAHAFAVRHAPGVQHDQATVEKVWHRGRPHRRYYRYSYRRYPYRGYRYRPYAYAPYPYYRRHYYYSPGAYVHFGPFGFGIW